MRYFLITLLAFVLMGASLEDARKANEAYNSGDYEKAITLYKKAIDATPDNTKLYFNLASAQAKNGMTQEAIRTFEQYKSMTDDADARAKANYNIGKVLSEAKKWDKAVDYYKKSLRYVANDPDAKHNFELAKKKKQEQKKKQQQQKQQSGDQNKQQQQNNQQQNKNQQQNNDQQQNQQKQEQQKQQADQQKQKQQAQPQKMSKQEAQKILQALEQKEKELLQKFKKQKTESSKSKNDKDW